MEDKPLNDWKQLILPDLNYDKIYEKGMKIYPQLGRDGLVSPPDSYFKRDDYEKKQISLCYRFLTEFDLEKTKHVRECSFSYSLKHKVENIFIKEHPRTDVYVSNGIFILTALYLDFKIKPANSLNAYLNISKRSLNQLKKTFEQLKKTFEEKKS